MIDRQQVSIGILDIYGFEIFQVRISHFSLESVAYLAISIEKWI